MGAIENDPETTQNQKRRRQERWAKKAKSGTIRCRFEVRLIFENQDLSKLIERPEDEVHDAVLVRVLLEIKDHPEIQQSEFETLGIYYQTTGSLITNYCIREILGIHGLLI